MPTGLWPGISAIKTPAFAASGSMNLRRAKSSTSVFSGTFAKARFPLPPLEVAGPLKADLNHILNADLVLQFSVGFDDGRVEVPSAIDPDFLDDVYSLGETVAEETLAVVVRLLKRKIDVSWTPLWTPRQLKPI